jgi:hypothetical protein
MSGYENKPSAPNPCAMNHTSQADIDSEKRKLIALYTAIGQFIFEFSQLEFMIRHTLGTALDLRETDANARFDIVTSPYDFADARGRHCSTG